MDNTLPEELLGSLDESRFPEAFLEHYEALECLAHNQMGETLLVRNRSTDLYYIAKCYSDISLLSGKTESDLLRNLNHIGLPKLVGEYRNDKMLCVIREYAEGMPLNQYVQINGVSKEQAIAVIEQLCDILNYLHGQKPPIIHRDIKPQNIIIDQEGKIKLIDFGISREYDENAKEDTISFGTRHFAAPEQYGFSQTDSRADIFSLGVLSGWLLTGEADYQSALSGIKSRRIRKVIGKCTEFAPERRYQSANQVKKQFLRASRSDNRSVLRGLLCISACIACLLIGFHAGYHMQPRQKDTVAEGVYFQEPLVEQAVRAALNKTANEALTETELLGVTELFIYGNQVAGSYEDFEGLGKHMMENDGQVYNGGLSNLEDITQLKNLKRLNIALEDITDLTPLAGLQKLEQLLIRHNPLEDITPLGSLQSMKELFLYDTCISDLSSLKHCYMLENMEIGKSYITSTETLQGITSLRILTIKENPLKTLSGLDTLINLEQFSLDDVEDRDLSGLLRLPRLKTVRLGEGLRESAETDLMEAEFELQFQ